MINSLLLFPALVFQACSPLPDRPKGEVRIPSRQEIVLAGSGVRIRPRGDVRAPILDVVFPRGKGFAMEVWIELPESVLARVAGGEEEIELYGNHHEHNEPPQWSIENEVIEYDLELAEQCHLTARATAEQDGLRLTYTITNGSTRDFEWVLAATCVRQESRFEDHYLERTYVHHRTGFELLASETPERTDMTLEQWLPCRYRAFHAWGWPAKRQWKIKRDGLVSYTKSRPIDLPFVATRSDGGEWVVATYSKGVGSVWTNPARTCQHADPTVELLAGETKTVELKVLLLQGGLEGLLKIVKAEMAR